MSKRPRRVREQRHGPKADGVLLQSYNPRTNLTATAIFGGLTPLVAQPANTASGWPSTPGLMIAIGNQTLRS